MKRAHAPRRLLEWYRDPEGHAVDARLHLLDRQMLDPDEVPVSTIDDIELSGVVKGETVDHRHPVAVAEILIGAAVLPRVFGGRMPRSRWARIEWDHVTKLDTVIRLDVHADDLDATWLERWIRDRIIVHIPGGAHAPE